MWENDCGIKHKVKENVMTKKTIISLAAMLTVGFIVFVRECSCPSIKHKSMGSWVPIGPEEIGASYYSGPNSGRATVIVVNPKNSNDVWLGTATGGVWHSKNITAPDYEWLPLTDAAPSLSIGSILLEDCSVERCNTVWVGTGENNIRRDTYYGCGLVKLTWDNDHYTMGIVGNTEERFKYGTIIDIKRLGSSLYIAVSKGKSASSSTAIVTAPEPKDGYGIHRSNDNGLTWEKVGTSPNGALPTDMEIQNGTLLVGFYNAGIFRLLSGDVWSSIGPAMTSTFDHVEIAVAPSNPNTIYLAYGQCESETYLCDNSPLFYVSTDGGTSWQLKYSDSGIGTYSRYTHALSINPLHEERVYYGGIFLMYSSDYGNDFNKVSNADEIHPDVQDIVFPDPNEPLIQYVATDGGIYLRDMRSGLGTTIPLNHGLSTVQQYSVSSSNWDGSQLLLGGAQDNGTVYFTGSPIWQFVEGGDGGDCIVASQDLFYLSWQEGQIERAITGDLQTGSFLFFMEGIDIMSDQSLFFSPFKMHPITHTLYCGRTRLYRRGENDPEWIAVSPIFDISTNQYTEIERRNAISAIALSRSNPNVVYVALYNGDVWVSGGTGPCADYACWTKIGGHGTTGGLPISVPTSLDVDPYDDRIAYITYSDFSDTPKIWRTINSGESWRFFNEGLPNNVPLKVVRVKPDENNILYLGTDEGVYRRDLFDLFPIGFSYWSFYGYKHGMPSVPVYAIDFDTINKIAYAATHGRGTYMLANEPIIYSPIIIFSSSGEKLLYIFGHGFQKRNVSKCSIAYLDKAGKVIARTSSDARGGVLDINEMGRLVSINKNKFGSTTMVVPCMEGDCLEVSEPGISLTKSEIVQIEVSYGDQRAVAKIKQHATIHRNPPSTLFEVRKLSDKSVGKVYMIAIAVGDTQRRISEDYYVSTLIGPEDNNEVISQKLAKNFNSVSSKRSARYQASVGIPKKFDPKEEDAFVFEPFISLKNKDLNAMQIFTAFKSDPGEANGLAFNLESIGLTMRNELISVKVTFTTKEKGAEGGSITFVQRTPAGLCRFKLKTIRGQLSEQIASNLYSSLMDMSYPGTRECESRHNSYDLQLQNSSVITSSAIGLSIEIEDRGVGVFVLPY
jgi:hypothetical protein